ncbi:LysR family transcriptional regulator [Pseudomonas sp. Pseusp122]|uniref:LysR family transcriptional regulator n=1 Tax=unclassified Pseudomonas TaxID=196821 RepID=UPI0039A439D1
MAFDERVLNGVGVFTAIVDTGTFAAAAQVLDMSPPGVSRSVARLEARLGIRLFDRTTRSVTLTDEGRRFHQQIVPLLSALEEVSSSASQGARAVRGRLRVNVDPLFSSLLLGPQLGAFMAEHPELELELVSRDRMGDMVADGFDLAVRFGEPRSSSLIARPLFDTRILTVASPAYLKKHGQPQTPRDLLKHACIQFRDPETGRPFDWEFHRDGSVVRVPVEGQITLNDVRTMHELCVSGYGVAQIMAFGSEALLAQQQVVNLFPDWPDERFTLYALYPSRIHPSAKTRRFLAFIQGLAT